MVFLIKDRVKDTTTTTGTGTLTLSGTAPTGFKNFTSIGDANECTYYVGTGADWEVRTGVVGASGTTLTRGTLLDSSTGSAVSFAAGSKDVFVTVPAGLVGYQQIGSTQTPTGVASSSITSIPAIYSDLLVEIVGLSHNSGSNQALRIELSGDNGTAWTTPTNVGGSMAAGGTWYGQVSLLGYLKGAGGTIGNVVSLTADTTVGTNGTSLIWRIAAGINAIRLSPAAGNFDAGSWKLWGRL